jgi:hypothetical protein
MRAMFYGTSHFYGGLFVSMFIIFECVSCTVGFILHRCEPNKGRKIKFGVGPHINFIQIQ